MERTELEQIVQYDYSYNDDFDITEIDARFSCLIGSFIIYFNSLENELNVCLADIIHSASHEMGYQIIEGLMMQNKIKLFYRLYLTLASNLAPRKKKRIKEIKDALTKINLFSKILVHGNWSLYNKNGMLRTKFYTDTKGNGEVYFKSIRVLKRDIKSKIAQIRKLELEIFELRDILIN